MIKSFGLLQFSFELFLFVLQLHLGYIAFSFKLTIFLLESINLSVLLLDGFLIWSFHFRNEFDSNHVLVKIGDNFNLKIFQFHLFLFNQQLQLFDLGS